MHYSWHIAVRTAHMVIDMHHIYANNYVKHTTMHMHCIYAYMFNIIAYMAMHMHHIYANTLNSQYTQQCICKYVRTVGTRGHEYATYTCKYIQQWSTYKNI